MIELNHERLARERRELHETTLELVKQVGDKCALSEVQELAVLSELLRNPPPEPRTCTSASLGFDPDAQPLNIWLR